MPLTLTPIRRPGARDSILSSAKLKTRLRACRTDGRVGVLPQVFRTRHPDVASTVAGGHEIPTDCRFYHVAVVVAY
jgi:hypothetical protein